MANYCLNSIASNLRLNGYAIIEDAVSNANVSEILSYTESLVTRVNANDLGSSFMGNTQYYTNIIANSKVVYDAIVSSLVLDLCTEVFGNGFTLVNNRIQTTRGSSSMLWHTDNNLLEDGRLVGRHDMPGLQFVLYLTDVSASPFQLIQNSHRWSLGYKEQYLLDDDIKKLNLEIVEIIPPPGSLLVLNTHLFHRAAPIIGKANVRSLLLFQVDKISNRYPHHGEKVFLNPEFLAAANPEIFSYLGFGRKRAYPPFPESSLVNLDLSHLLSLQARLLRALPRALVLKYLKRAIPSSLLAKFKNFLVSHASRQSLMAD